MSFFERTDVFAALDLGTTNCRLLVARPAGDGMRIIDSFSRIVRLGEGLDASGLLSDIAMERTIDALGVCSSKLRQRRVTHARLVATEACRRATNCAEFLGRVRNATGLELEIIPTSEEARLALAGCAPLLDPHRPHAVVFDIGGGSTEVLWVRVRTGRRGRPRTEVKGIVSIPFGVVALTERFCERGQSPQAFDEMVDYVRTQFLDFDERWGISRQIARGGVQMLGSSGTVTTLAGIKLGLPRYDRAQVDGGVLDFRDIADVTAGLVAMDGAGRAAQPCVGAGRADLMPAGCAILKAICTLWPVGRLRVADRGVREGILAGLMAAARRSATQPDAVSNGRPLPT
ncbi:MAG TPA: Ppx/GppA phosphatase family protein [Aliidongia sp.]|nr:Ppx/GppA phosphatase family protein [Aliidongia sp.]